MTGTVKLPGLGEVKKSTAAIGAVIIAGVGVVIFLRNRRAASSAAATPDTSTIDPATGFPSGSPEDQQALAEQSAAAGGFGFGSLGNGGAFFGSGGGGSIIGPSGPGGFADNAQWAQYAEQYLTETVGSNPETTGNALGKYITGQPLTAGQVQITEQAIAFAGYPPVEGPGGNPPGFRNAPGPHPKPKPKPKVAVPNVAGKKYQEAASILAAHHLRARRAVPDVGVVGEQKPAAGTEVARNSTVTLYPAKHRK